MPVWDVFSKRGKPLPDTYFYNSLPEALRNQVLRIWGRTFDKYNIGPKYEHIKEIVCSEHGLMHLSGMPDAGADVVQCLLICQDVPLVLDVLAAR